VDTKLRTLFILIAASICTSAVVPSFAGAGVLHLESCAAFRDNAAELAVNGQVWQGFGAGGYGFVNRCSQGGSLQIVANKNAAYGENGQWRTITPPSLGIVAVYTPANDVLMNPYLGANGWKAGYFWSGGTQGIADGGKCCGAMDYAVGINRADLHGSRYFGFQTTCGASSCPLPADSSELLDLRGIILEAVDNTPPAVRPVGPVNLWTHVGGYVRGTWPMSFQASDDSGICAMYEAVDGQTFSGPVDPKPNHGSWTQCPTPQTTAATVDTTRYHDGPLLLTGFAADAAAPANASSPAQTLHVDNQPVTLSLSGPTDAPSTAGVETVAATAAAGPSGVAGIACSLDGAPYVWRPGASAQVPVTGVGQHQVSCYGQNSAQDVYGAPARSSTGNWALSIRRPTVIGASFARIVDSLRCRRRSEKIRVPAHWVAVSDHGTLIHVRVPARTQKVNVTHCHPRLVRQRRRVHGRWEVIRVPVFPHLVQRSVERVGFGKRTAVSGWLGMADGTALAGQTVRILTTPDDGSGRFAPTVSATTAADGTWTAKLPAGPSRLVEAVYGGSATTEPVGSADVRIAVPARLRIRVAPVHVRWGTRIVISGRLQGGYIPVSKTAVAQLLRLRIGVQGVSETAGIPDVTPRGRFRTTYCFNSGHGVAHFWFSVSTLNEADYPFARAGSRRAAVTVGPRVARHPC
jgi:hypothetical protein